MHIMKIDILLRAKYDKNFSSLNEFLVIIKDRFKEQDIIDGNNIKDVTKHYIILKDNTYIPSHRIIKIKKKF